MKRLVLAAALAVLPFATAAQAPPPAPQGPTLRASVDQVVVDVVVTDEGGKVVTGLTAADFEIRERDQPQTVATFAEVSLPFTIRSGGELTAASDVRSNTEDDGRLYVLLLDDYHVGIDLTALVRETGREFLRRHVQPGDLVAVVTTSGLGGTRQELTSDLPRADAAIQAFIGRGGASRAPGAPGRAATAGRNADRLATRQTSAFGIGDPTEDSMAEFLDRARASFDSLRRTADALASVSGRRKTVLFFSEGVAIPANDDRGLNADLQAVVGAAARANVAVYALDPRGLQHVAPDTAGSAAELSAALLTATQQRILAAAMLRDVAERTGGTASIDRNDTLTPLRRVVEESSHYYMLGYVSPDARRDGRYRSIDVRVKRPGLQVRARKGYLEPDDKAARKARDKSPEPKGPLADLIRRPVPTAGLTLRAQAIVLPLSRNNVRVVVEVAPEALRFDGAVPRNAALDLVIVPVGSDGQVGSSIEGHATLPTSPQDAAVVREHGLRLLEQLTLAPGGHQLRIAVRESVRGLAGSVLCEVVVPEPKGGLTLSSVAISSRQAGRIPSATRDEALETALGGRPPTTARSFQTDDVMSAYAEVIDAGATSVRAVDVSTVIRDAAGKELVRSPQPNANQNVAAGRSFAYVVDLPLKTLAPGRYTLRVEARAQGAAAVVARDVPFEVRSAAP